MKNPLAVAAIILAGRRSDVIDPLAQAHGVIDKCLVPLNGQPLIEHVAQVLGTSPWIDTIIISINDPNLVTDLPVCWQLRKDGRLLAIKASDNLADSIIAAAARTGYPALVTTADNVLLSHEGIETIVRQSIISHADAAAAFARKDDILAAHPDGQRRFYQFADDGYSNCNCYWIGSEEALQAAEVFRGGGQFAKHPLRIVKAFGLRNLIRFRFGMGTLESVFERFSARFGIAIRPVIFDDGALAIDVDNARTHAIASELMAARTKVEERLAA